MERRTSWGQALACCLLAGAFTVPALADKTKVSAPAAARTIDGRPALAPGRLKHATPLIQAPLATLEQNGGHVEAIAGRTDPAAPVAEAPKPRAAAAAGSATSASAKLLTITPLCPTLSINTAYTLTGTTTGGSYCYHFQVTQRAKTTAFLIGQNANTNFALTLIRHEENDTLTVLGTSDSPGNVDESLLTLTQPGHYYWLMDANASDGSAFQFGAIVNTAADANELNDTVGLSTTVPVVRTPMSGNMDSASDVDYFQFVATNGQDLYLRLNDSYGLNEWKFEYYTGSFWSPLSLNTDYTLANLPSAPYTLRVRVSPSPSATLNTAHTYSLIAGSQVTSSDMVNVTNSENLARVPLGATTPSLVTQAHNSLSWSIRLLDSVGNPVAGVPVSFIYATEDIAETRQTVNSAASGIAGATLTLPNCVGNNNVLHAWAGNNWRTYFDFGVWNIKAAGADPDEVGVGGSNYPTVTLGHICTQQLQ